MSNKYLDQLAFDPKLKESFVYKYITNIRLVILLIISILLVGITSYISLSKRLNPEVQIPNIIITTLYPGAGPEDVEKLVTIPIENQIKKIEGISTVTSSSQENFSTVIIEFDSDVNGKEAENDVTSEINKIQLPQDVQEPTITLLDFEDQYIWKFAIFTEDSLASLDNFSRNLKDEIENISGVDRVETSGLEDLEIAIEVENNKIKENNVNALFLSQIINSFSSSYPGGNTNFNNTNFPISIENETDSLQKIRNLQINNNGQLIKLSDFAGISIKPTPNQPNSYILNEGKVKNIIVFSVFKTKDSDIIKTQNVVQDKVNESLSKHDIFKLQTIENNADVINDQFKELFSNFITTILLVFITLLLFLGIRQAFIVSLSIPLTFLISFTVMRMTGLTLNFLTLFSLLLALGLLVDDAIVIVTAMTSYNKTNKFTPQETGMLVWRDFIVPIWSTTITTVWAFLPLLLSTGIIGEFIKSIPIVVSATLIASTSVAVLITLPVMIVMIKPSLPKRVLYTIILIFYVLILCMFVFLLPKNVFLALSILVYTLVFIIIYKYKNRAYDKIKSSKVSKISNISDGIVNTQKLVNAYNNLLTKIIYSSKNLKLTVIIVIIFSIFSYMLVPTGFVKNEFFPASDSENIFINIKFPEGTSLQKTDEESKLFFNEYFSSYEFAKVSTLEIGKSFSEDFTAGGGTNENKALITLNLIDKNNRQSSIQLENQIKKDISNYTKADLTVTSQSGGPPAGADLNIKYLGEDLSELQNLANNTINYLKDIEGVSNVEKSISTGTSKIIFEPNISKLTQQGLTTADIGLIVRTYVSGFKLADTRIGDEEYDIVLRIDKSSINPSNLNTIEIANTSISEFGTYKLKPNPTIITREDGQRSISVSASVQDGYNIPDLNNQLEEYAEDNITSGYNWKTGGVNDENQKSVNSIFQAMILSAILILVTMVIQLGSFRKAIIVLLVIPLALSGVFIVFSLTNTPLSFPALIGLLALFGIVVNNSIVIVEKINQNIKVGLNMEDSIIDASSSRLEPIMFSSLTTIMGLLPITISDPLWRGLGGAIISGLLFSGAIMLLFIPSVYYLIYKDRS